MQSVCSFSGPTGEGMRAFPALQPCVFVCGRVCVCGGPAGELCSGELGRVGGSIWSVPATVRRGVQPEFTPKMCWIHGSQWTLTASTLKNTLAGTAIFHSLIVFMDTYTLNDSIDQFYISDSKHRSPH